ncbi:GspH/FimT family pseudopilin [Luteimonas aestuarii]|nr:GspH/FimT family pseudopilin [Luteimonas aestuarii]
MGNWVMVGSSSAGCDQAKRANGNAVARLRPFAVTNRKPRITAPPGFTLVELMVVLAILGVAGAAVALSLPPGDASLHRQADAFALHLQRAREEAILAARPVRVRADADGYAFEARTGRAWQPLAAPAFASRRWQGETRPLLAPREPHVTFAFEPTGSAEARTLVLALGDHRAAVVVEVAGKVRVDDAMR